MVPLWLKRRVKLALHVLTHDAGEARASEPDQQDISPAGCPTDALLKLDACPVCGHGERTRVCEYNKFVLMDRPPDDVAPRYDYSLCHACGVVYAARRPVGERYQWLFRHFEETIGRADTGLRSIRKLTVSAFELSDEERDELRQAAAVGVFVSDHLKTSRKDYIPSLLTDRLATAPHVELLGSLLPLTGARVLEIRSRTGSMSGALARLYGARPHVMALFEHQRFVIEEVYGIPAAPMDYDHFTLPTEEPFDLIIANHMFTHAVRPAAFLETLRRALVPGGHLYLYNEPDDAEFLAEGRSMFNTLNAFHVQAFDGPALTRALAANGFDVTFQTRSGGSFLCLSRAASAPRTWDRIEPRQLEQRRAQYAAARDTAVMTTPRHLRSRLGEAWVEAADRTLADGRSEIDDTGQVRLRRRPRRPG